MNKRFMQKVAVSGDVGEGGIAGYCWDRVNFTSWCIEPHECAPGYAWMVNAGTMRRTITSADSFGTQHLAFEAMVAARYMTAEQLAAGAAASVISREPGDELCYFALAREVGRVKIGKTRDVAKRMSQIRGMSPVLVDVYGVIGNPKAECADLETLLHLEFNQYRTHGEWFTWTEAVKNRLDYYLKCWEQM